MGDDYQFEDAETAPAQPAAPQGQGWSTDGSGGGGGNGGSRGGGQGFAQDIFSKKINAKFRIFYVDLKESSNGRFIKISEKSHGRKSTIMMDGEDLPAMIEALQEVQKQL